MYLRRIRVWAKFHIETTVSSGNNLFLMEQRVPHFESSLACARSRTKFVDKSGPTNDATSLKAPSAHSPRSSLQILKELSRLTRFVRQPNECMDKSETLGPQFYPAHPTSSPGVSLPARPVAAAHPPSPAWWARSQLRLASSWLAPSRNQGFLATHARSTADAGE